MSEPELRESEHNAGYRAGYDQALLDSDAKLAEALDGLKRANDIHAQLKSERDMVLEELAQYMFVQANRGLLAMGYHPPGAHLDAATARRIGSRPCPRCKPAMKPWAELTQSEKKIHMGRVFEAVKKTRARADAQAPTPAPLDFDSSKAAGPVIPPDLNQSQQMPPVKPSN